MCINKNLVTTRKDRIKDLFKANEQTPAFINARKFAKDDEMNILITGENGTGKEVLAEYIHENSLRADKPFIIANLASIPESLLQSTLFGHIKGAFTGAIYDKKGFLNAADGGTVFLDEIGDIGFDTQVALLRFLDYGEIQIVGKDHPDVVDVRVIAATNANLHEKIADKLFREDLYYRLAGAQLHLEPLRAKSLFERKEILNELISETAKHNNKNIIHLTDRAWKVLLNYEFPGNYRLARNIIERLYGEDKSIIDFQDIENIIILQPGLTNNVRRTDIESNLNVNTSNRFLTLKQQNAIIVFNTLQRHNGVKKEALKELGISFKTLNAYLSEYKSIGNIPNSIGNNPINDWKKDNSNFQIH